MNEFYDEIIDKHRKEKKDLQAKIQSMKKNKTDKKKRKEILEEMSKLEIDLENRQKNELESINQTQNPKTSIIDNNISKEDNTNKRISKAQKRRDKKVQEAKQKEAEIIAAEELNQNGPRLLEIKNLTQILKKRGLQIFTIPSDGDCLYNAIRHQLEVTGRSLYDVKFLRNETAKYILLNKDSLIAYMTNSKTGDLLSDTEFEEYCEDLRSTNAWGGELEIKALSNVLQAPIEIIQASGPPTIQGLNEFKEPRLIISYHRHMYSLGEHYNSTETLIEDVAEF